MNSRIRILCQLSTFVALTAVSGLVGIASGDEELRVLPIEIIGGPSKQMLSRYLQRQAHQAFDRREAKSRL